MGFHTFTAGEVLTAANVNSFLMNQSVIVCTSGTRPASPVAGMTIYETDTGLVRVYSGTAWDEVGSHIRKPYYYGANTAAPSLTGGQYNLSIIAATNSYAITNASGAYTVSVAGIYRVSGGAAVANAGGTIGVMLRKNSGGTSSGGTPISYGTAPVLTTNFSGASCTGMVSLAVNDYVQMFVFPASTAATAADVTGLHIEMELVSLT